MTATSAQLDPSAISFDDYGKAGHFSSGCAVATKDHENTNQPAGKTTNLDQGAALGRNGALCMGQPRKTTPGATGKGFAPTDV